MFGSCDILYACGRKKNYTGSIMETSREAEKLIVMEWCTKIEKEKKTASDDIINASRKWTVW